MRISVRHAVRDVVFVASVASLTVLLAPPAPARSPYLSALSDVLASPVYAAGCPDKGCYKGIDCVPTVGLKCIHFNGKGCSATTC